MSLFTETLIEIGLEPLDLNPVEFSLFTMCYLKYIKSPDGCYEENAVIAKRLNVSDKTVWTHKISLASKIPLKITKKTVSPTTGKKQLFPDKVIVLPWDDPNSLITAKTNYRENFLPEEGENEKFQAALKRLENNFELIFKTYKTVKDRLVSYNLPKGYVKSTKGVSYNLPSNPINQSFNKSICIDPKLDHTNEDKENTYKEFKILVKDNLTQTNSQLLTPTIIEEVLKGRDNTLSALCADPIANYNPTHPQHMSKTVIIQNLTVIQNSNTNSIPLDYSSNNRPTREDNNFKPQYNNNPKQIQSAANKEKFGAILVETLRPVFDKDKYFDFKIADELKGLVDLDELRELRDWMSKKFYKIKITFVTSSSELMKEIERVKKLRQDEIDEREKRKIEQQKPKQTEEEREKIVEILNQMKKENGFNF